MFDFTCKFDAYTKGAHFLKHLRSAFTTGKPLPYPYGGNWLSNSFLSSLTTATGGQEKSCRLQAVRCDSNFQEVSCPWLITLHTKVLFFSVPPIGVKSRLKIKISVCYW